MIKREKKSVKHPNRSKRIVYKSNDKTNRELYAITVEKYFKSVPDKDVRFKPYTASEEREMIEKYRNDRQTMENLLTEHNIFFALNYASTQAYRFSDYDELISLAMNGLRAAATTFDPDKGYRFNTWAPFYLKNFILRKFYVKKESEIDNNIGIYLDSNVPTTSNDGSSDYTYSTMKDIIEPSVGEKYSKTFIDDMEGEEDENRYRNIARKIIRSVETSSLSTLDKKVFVKSFIEESSIQTISKELKKSKSVISNSKNRVITFITEKFPKESIFSF